MKSMSASGSAGEEEWLDDSRFDGDDTVLVLQNTFDHEKRIVDDDGVIFFEKLRRDDDICHTGLIFEAQEYKSFRGSRTLANDDRACHAHQ